MTRGRLLSVLVAVGLAACAGVLGLRPAPPRAFPHRAHAMAGVTCVKCHTTVASAGPSSPLDLPGTERCVTCHAQPHDRSPCGRCHGREQDRRQVAQAKAHLAFSHADHVATVQGACTRCHDTVLHRDGPLRPPMATCLSCHEHRQQWASRACLPCHADLRDEHERPASHVVHGADFMSRHGLAAAGSRELCSTCHAESECVQCHGVNVAALPSTLHFEQPGQADMHARGFMARHSIEASLDPATCASCHREQELCRDCHERKGLTRVSPARGSPHPPGYASATSNPHGAEARRDPVRCASCHGGAGEALCAGCHRVGGPGGDPHPPGFSSSKRRSELPCRLCHLEEP